jgi:hypothetical protein
VTITERITDGFSIWNVGWKFGNCCIPAGLEDSVQEVGQES